MTLAQWRIGGVHRPRRVLGLALVVAAIGLAAVAARTAEAQSVGVQVGITNQAPVITSLAPSAVPPNTSATIVIGGNNFSGLTFTTISVAFDGSPATAFSVDSPTQITAQTPWLPPGTYSVQVQTSSGATSTSPNGADRITVTSAAPPPPPPPIGTRPPPGPPGSTGPGSTGPGSFPFAPSQQPVTAEPPPAVEASPNPSPSPSSPTSSPGPGAVVHSPPQAPGPETGSGVVKGVSDAGSGFFGLNNLAAGFFGFYGGHVLASVFLTAVLLGILLCVVYLVTRKRRNVAPLPKIRF